MNEPILNVSREPRFEGFAIQLATPADKAGVENYFGNLGRGDWTFTPIHKERSKFEVTSEHTEFSIKEAWETTYRLRTKPEILYIEPLFESAVPTRDSGGNQPESATFPAGLDADTEAVISTALACRETNHIAESDDASWSLRIVNIPQAHQQFFAGRLPGEGIFVGHPDTGYSKHPEIFQRLDLSKAKDFVDGDNDPVDPLDDGLLLFPGHGTGTASVIISPPESQQPYPSGKHISGVAYGARLIPLRVTRSVILGVISILRLSHAIEHAVSEGAHVISMSLGTPLWSWRLRQAILFAQQKGVIVCAAAGNCVSFVTWPAAYDEVIGVGACNARKGIWKGSSLGSKVDVIAPGESVWRAETKMNNDYDVLRGSGTSYAVAIVAGLAAMWLSYHRRDEIIDKYGAEKVPMIFNHLLRKTASTQNLWDPDDTGAGLVDAVKLLSEPLPDGITNLGPSNSLAFEEHASVDSGEIDTFQHLFEEVLSSGETSRKALEGRLAELLNVPQGQVGAKLKEIGQEVAFHFALNPDLYDEFASALKSAGPDSLARESTAASRSIEATRKRLQSKDLSSAVKATLSQ